MNEDRINGKSENSWTDLGSFWLAVNSAKNWLGYPVGLVVHQK